MAQTPPAPGSAQLLRLSSGAVIDLGRCELRREGGIVPLTAMEVKLLAYLGARAGRAVTRAEILREVWGYRPGLETRAIDNAIKRLRARLERDPTEPEHLKTVFGVGYCLDGVEVQEAPAPTASSEQLVGRAEELAAVRAGLEENGLLTITGPGGAGKTRLARQLLLEREGGRFLDLSAARSPEDLVRLMAAALGVMLVRENPDQQRAQVGKALAASALPLLVLDNLEQIPGAYEVLAPWVTLAPRTRWLLTSRVRLAQEATLALGPLGEDPGLQLFLLRAAQVGVEPKPEQTNRRIVALLDGLPLAIELAAVRTRMLSASELLERLGQSMGILRDPTGVQPDRHASLAAVVAWSWELLPPWQRLALAQLAVFAGGAELDAVEAVLRLPEGALAIDAVQGLCDASLLWVEAASAEARRRVRLPMSVAEYANAQLDPSERAAAEGRHRDHYLRQARGWVAGVRGARGQDCCERLAQEAENLLEIRRRFAVSDPDAAAEAALALDALWTHRGPLGARRELVRAALENPPHDPGLYARLLCARASLSHMGRSYAEAEADVQTGLVLARARGDRAAECQLLRALGRSLMLRREHAGAARILAEAEALAQDEPLLRTALLAELFRALWTAGVLDAAEATAERALVCARACGARWDESWVLERLGLLLAERGEMGLAKLRIEEAVRIAREIGKWNLGSTLYHLGVLHQLRWSEPELRAALRGGWQASAPTYDLARSEAILLEVAQSHARGGMVLDQSAALSTLWTVLRRMGETSRATETIQEAIALAEQDGAQRFTAWFRCKLAIDRALDGELELARSLARRAAEVPALRDHVSGPPLEVAVRAAIALGQGDPPEARRILAELAADEPLPEGVRHGIVWGACEVILSALGPVGTG